MMLETFNFKVTLCMYYYTTLTHIRPRILKLLKRSNSSRMTWVELTNCVDIMLGNDTKIFFFYKKNSFLHRIIKDSMGK